MTGTADAISPEALLIACGAGDRAAFRQLYDLTAPRLTAIALRLTRRRDLAADALQEAYIRVWRAAHRFDPERGSALGWMATIMRRCALDRLPGERPYDDIATVEIALPAAEPREIRLDRCIAGLSEAQRDAVLLAYFDGLSHSELAERMEVPLGTAKAWVRRGVAALRQCLEAV